jgi:hypothetical protein
MFTPAFNAALDAGQCGVAADIAVTRGLPCWYDPSGIFSRRARFRLLNNRVEYMAVGRKTLLDEEFSNTAINSSLNLSSPNSRKDRTIKMNNGNSDQSTTDLLSRTPKLAGGKSTADELSRLKHELLQAEVRLAKARATATGAEIDIKVITARLKTHAK